MAFVTYQLTETQAEALMALLDHTADALAQDVEALAKDGEDTSAIEDLQESHSELVQALVSSKTFAWKSACGRFSLPLPEAAVDAITDGTLSNIAELTQVYPEAVDAMEAAMKHESDLVALIKESELAISDPASLYPHELLWALVRLAHQEITCAATAPPEAA